MPFWPIQFVIRGGQRPNASTACVEVARRRRPALPGWDVCLEASPHFERTPKSNASRFSGTRALRGRERKNEDSVQFKNLSRLRVFSMALVFAVGAVGCRDAAAGDAPDASASGVPGDNSTGAGGGSAAPGAGGVNATPALGSGGGAPVVTKPTADGGVIGDAGLGGDAGIGDVLVLPSDGNALSVCSSDDDCNGDDLLCAAFGNFRGYCAEDCKIDADCAKIDGITPACDATGRCVVDCVGAGKGDGACPNDMVCAEVMTSLFSTSLYRCQYPEPKNHVVFEPCDSLRADSDCEEGLTCSVFVGLPLLSDITLPYCAASCAEATDCNAQGSGATPVCDLSNPLSTKGLCALECTDDKQCPGDMLCRTLDLLRRRCGFAP